MTRQEKLTGATQKAKELETLLNEIADDSYDDADWLDSTLVYAQIAHDMADVSRDVAALTELVSA